MKVVRSLKRIVVQARRRRREMTTDGRTWLGIFVVIMAFSAYARWGRHNLNAAALCIFTVVYLAIWLGLVPDRATPWITWSTIVVALGIVSINVATLW